MNKLSMAGRGGGGGNAPVWPRGEIWLSRDAKGIRHLDSLNIYSFFQQWY